MLVTELDQTAIPWTAHWVNIDEVVRANAQRRGTQHGNHTSRCGIGAIQRRRYGAAALR